jgi:hypothetical protein
VGAVDFDRWSRPSESAAHPANRGNSANPKASTIQKRGARIETPESE